jgi:MoaA/NifB/PqqE/SkfB family radical SAM enzyme
VSELKDSFTSTGEKLFFHQEAMAGLRSGRGMPISAWCAPTDVCNAKCSFCSVGERAGDVLPFAVVKGFIDQLVPLGLKSITFSGGGNFLLYKCKLTGKDCNDVIDYAHGQGLECALITNGMPLVEYDCKIHVAESWKMTVFTRKSWKTMRPETLDKLTWCRISMAGLDANHKEQCVYVPDFDRTKTALGFSWIMSDSYEEPSHKHGWVSTPEDIRTPMEDRKVVLALDRLPWIEEQVRHYVETYQPAYTRLLCNCLQPDQIPERHRVLSEMAGRINPAIVFSQFKPPRQPKKNCAKIYPHPCLNADGFCYPCDSVVLNRTAGHKFNSEWRVCRWDEVGELYSRPIRQVIPNNICPGCVFADQVDLIGEIIEGRETPVPAGRLEHVNFV